MSIEEFGIQYATPIYLIHIQLHNFEYYDSATVVSQKAQVPEEEITFPTQGQDKEEERKANATPETAKGGDQGEGELVEASPLVEPQKEEPTPSPEPEADDAGNNEPTPWQQLFAAKGNTPLFSIQKKSQNELEKMCEPFLHSNNQSGYTFPTNAFSEDDVQWVENSIPANINGYQVYKVKTTNWH